jgi:mono/diheme cytochrome c family protein
MRLTNLLPGLTRTLRRHANTAGLALGVTALSMAAYAAAGPGSASADRPVARSPVVAQANMIPQFEQNCVACHGADAKGVEGLGVNLIESGFVAKKSESELVAFLKQGRLPDDPDSRTHRPMPSFSWVAESDLQAIASFLKSAAPKNQAG